MAVRMATVRKLALALPGVAEGPCYGTAGFRVRGKLFLREHQDGQHLVLRVADLDEQEWRLRSDPKLFELTDHYRGHPWVLVRLAAADRAALADLIEGAWALRAPRKLVSERASA